VRAARSSKLPTVLDRDEVREVIRAVSPFHNQVFYWTVYSLGLRVSEASNLQPADIDSARMLVHVHRVASGSFIEDYPAWPRQGREGRVRAAGGA